MTLLLVLRDPKAREEQHLGSFEFLIPAKAPPPRGILPITEGVASQAWQTQCIE